MVRRVFKKTGRLFRNFWERFYCKFYYKPSGESKRFERFRDKYRGKRCFIIGTGPSLNVTDVESLSKECTFAVKSFLFTGIERFKFVPTFFCWSDRGTLINNLHLFPSEMPEGMICFFPFALRKQVLGPLRRSRSRLFFIRDVYSLNVHRGHFSVDPTDRFHCSGSVIIDYCIPMAIYMGFEAIYLVGCDHCNVDGKRYFDGRSKSLSGFSTPWDIVTQAFETVARYADAHGIRIYNATVGGELNVFPRVSLKDTLLDEGIS